MAALVIPVMKSFGDVAGYVTQPALKFGIDEIDVAESQA
jgi:hypothetical protein